MAIIIVVGSPKCSALTDWLKEAKIFTIAIAETPNETGVLNAASQAPN